MYRSPQWGTVNLGQDTLQGHGEQSQPGKADYDKNNPGASNKQQYNPGRNQELNLPADFLCYRPNITMIAFAPEGKAVPIPSIHERIKELLGKGLNRKEAIKQAKKEAGEGDHGDVGTITQKEVYRSKYQAESPAKKISPFSEQVQGYPYI